MKIASGIDYTIIVKGDGTLLATGQNDRGQLGIPNQYYLQAFTQVDNVNNVKDIACGQSHTIILKKDGTIWGCGDNSMGELGMILNNNSINVFTQIDTSDVKSISCTYFSTNVLKNDGTLWGCGSNGDGELGLGTQNLHSFSKLQQIKTNGYNVKNTYGSYYTSYILKNDGTLWATGSIDFSTDYQHFGLGENIPPIHIYTQINDNVKDVYLSPRSVIVLKNDGTLWCAGINTSGEFGLGDNLYRSTFTQINFDTSNIKKMCKANNNTFILQNDGTLWGCGYNGSGGLGLGDNVGRYVFTKIPVSDIADIIGTRVGLYIIKNDMSVWTAGSNEDYRLGLPLPITYNTFTKINGLVGDLNHLSNINPNSPMNKYSKMYWKNNQIKQLIYQNNILWER